MAKNKPDLAFAPGTYIAEAMEGKQLTVAGLASGLGIENDKAASLLAGDEPVTQEIAEALGRLFGTSAGMWLNLEQSYRSTLEGWNAKQLMGRLSKIRKDRGLTQKDVATAMAMDQTRIAKYEKDPSGMALSRFLAYASAVGVSIEVASGDSENQPV